ncbi:MAG: 30S ribosome-binding factor RbfA [Planctomycetota bacterium]|jgi:ribosome-binding factor A
MPPEVDDDRSGTSLRCRRVAESIKEVAGRIITQELSDPRVGFVTVTRVKVSPDLKQARLFFSVLGAENERALALKALRHAAGFIKRRCGDELDLRYTPNLKFEFDEGIDKSIRVSELLYSESDDEAPAKLPPLEEPEPEE